ncbi:SMP-30/gluconolactonase/LRE family protein [Curtobacterium pusillum]|uniref:SMP-30/gluconolactonase/LRE family protein n=1 Tax=Curtobacterium pusillum TaxID=69373 RepID=UPI003808FBE6
MTRYQARVASSERHVLAEGPVRTSATGVLWVDVVRGHVFRGEIVGDRISRTVRLDFAGMVGAAVPGPGAVLLVAAQESLVVVDGDGRRAHGPRVVPADDGRRTNDGAVDPSGRFLIGTLPLDDRSGAETLVRVEDDGSSTVIDDDLSLSNGLAWSPDGSTLYSTDTVPGIVWARPYDPRSGVVGPRHVHLHVTDGYPDGICVDTDDHVWVAVWGAGEVRRYAPDGRVTDTVAVPAPHVSSVAFVGPHHDRLLITTASRDLSADELARHPDAGRLFLVDVPARGVPTTPWNAAWATAS